MRFVLDGSFACTLKIQFFVFWFFYLIRQLKISNLDTHAHMKDKFFENVFMRLCVLVAVVCFSFLNTLGAFYCNSPQKPVK